MQKKKKKHFYAEINKSGLIFNTFEIIWGKTGEGSKKWTPIPPCGTITDYMKDASVKEYVCVIV